MLLVCIDYELNGMGYENNCYSKFILEAFFKKIFPEWFPLGRVDGSY